jgi:hypothetical protein
MLQGHPAECLASCRFYTISVPGCLAPDILRIVPGVVFIGVDLFLDSLTTILLWAGVGQYCY